MDGGSPIVSVPTACATHPERLLAAVTTDRAAIAATHALLKVPRSCFRGLPVEILINRGCPPSVDQAVTLLSLTGLRFLGAEPRFAGSIPKDPGLKAHCEEGANLIGLHSSFPASKVGALVDLRLAAEQETVRAADTVSQRL